MLLHLLGDAVGRRQDVVIVDEGAAAELSLQVHQSSLHTTRQPIEVDKPIAAGACVDWVKCNRKMSTNTKLIVLVGGVLVSP